MRRKPIDPTKTPRTRKELLQYLWDREVYANVCKEGPQYILECNGVCYATHLRRIDSLSFEQWEKDARWVATTRLY